MSAIVTIEETQSHLAELIASMQPGEEFVITQNERPVAKLIAQGSGVRLSRQPGSAKDKLMIQAGDDEHLRDFEEHMP
jgi:antitoxin (DNA-binding transcriptional repressor) of toxin-antitoxin stability system